MIGVARPVVISLVAVGTAASVLGFWWCGSGGSAAAPGLAQYTAVAVGASLLGGFILWHRPRNRYGLAHLTLGVLFGSVVLAAGALGHASSLPPWAVQLSLAWSWVSIGALLPLWVVVIATFPDGSFHRRVMRRATVALAGVVTLLSTVGYLLFPSDGGLPLVRVDTPVALVGPLAGSGPASVYELVSATGAVIGTAAPLLAVVALVDRYRQSGLVVRQQIKWLLVGAAVSVLLQAIPVQALDSVALRETARVLVVLAVPLPLVAAAIAIFRYRLWEIDVVISHGLVYALVSGTLTLVFLGAAVGAGVTVGGADVRVVAAVGLALLVSVLARPLRLRLVTMVERALYGDEPRGLLALARLADTTDRDLDARGHGSRIAEVARSALGASWAGVWLFLRSGGSGSLRPLAAVGVEPGPPVVLPSHAVASLAALSGGRLLTQVPGDVAGVLHAVLGGRQAVVAALAVQGELVGLIACGDRARDPFGDEDAELLTVLAHESALALQNIHLEGELRQRLEQIEQQAVELRRSRQRLVVAQDSERRRIERDLHDGAQQQLVALAARLRRAAHADELQVDEELAGLADEAEEAVFTLQELARGIYPSLLADRGLHAALQVHAARLPVDVRIEVGPTMHGRRLLPEIAAALYYVAMEAMTNAVKHAPGTSISVLLRPGDTGRSFVLEVHDDGAGFDPSFRSGSGIQNMTDRIEAVGGAFSIESAPGAGTWVRVEVTEPVPATDIRRGTASPSGRSAPQPPAG
jgi:signal transduction histidine kinase